MSNAVTWVVDAALTTRIRCGTPPWEDCARHLERWGQGWCAFLRRLWEAASLLPDEGRVTSALNTSVAELLLDKLPEALAEPVIGLAGGAVGLADGLFAVRNVSLIFVSYLEYALFLGSEMLDHGTSRVGRAVFHGEAASRGWKDGLVHRADVLHWALQQHGPLEAPRMAELGVSNAEVGKRLLSLQPWLRWTGVDPFEMWVQADGSATISPEAGDLAFAAAQLVLAPWLGDRAKLLRAKSTEVEDAALELPLDLVFVDAMHHEEAVLEDFAAWVPRVRPGGIVAGHDYSHAFPGVVRAAHASLPRGATLHLGPNAVYWWRQPE